MPASTKKTYPTLTQAFDRELLRDDESKHREQLIGSRSLYRKVRDDSIEHFSRRIHVQGCVGRMSGQRHFESGVNGLFVPQLAHYDDLRRAAQRVRPGLRPLLQVAALTNLHQTGTRHSSAAETAVDELDRLRVLDDLHRIAELKAPAVSRREKGRLT